MPEEHHEEVVWHIVVVGDSLLLFSEIVREGCLKVVRARGEDDLVAVNWFAFYHQRDIAELGLVQDG